MVFKEKAETFKVISEGHDLPRAPFTPHSWFLLLDHIPFLPPLISAFPLPTMSSGSLSLSGSSAFPLHCWHFASPLPSPFASSVPPHLRKEGNEWFSPDLRLSCQKEMGGGRTLYIQGDKSLLFSGRKGGKLLPRQSISPPALLPHPLPVSGCMSAQIDIFLQAPFIPIPAAICIKVTAARLWEGGREASPYRIGVPAPSDQKPLRCAYQVGHNSVTRRCAAVAGRALADEANPGEGDCLKAGAEIRGCRLLAKKHSQIR